ncbi:MAG: hypothetical protein SFT81_00790 [Candidatus Caenarcaniphilales bacterium]|nr:hypothetical protein [Candidatus Caenarcaniphilales bacterium]
MISLDTSLLTFDLKALCDEKADRLTEIKGDLIMRADKPNDWLGWLKLHTHQQTFTKIQAFADQKIASGKFQNLVVVGIGGSALGPQALIQALHHPLWNELSREERKGGLKVYFIDNVDPDWTESILMHLKPQETLYCVITKSGGTAETISAFLWILDRLKKELGAGWKDHLIGVTDPEKGTLRAFVEREKIESFPVPANVGGRFSVFSSVGMLPLALTGIKIEKFRSSLEKTFDRYLDTRNDDYFKNIPFALAVALVQAESKLGRRINPLMPYSSHLARIADWYVQLVAESLGKSSQIGPTPIKAVGATDQHSQLQLFAEGPADKIIFFLKVGAFRQDFPLPAERVEGFTDLAGESMQRLIHAEGEGTAKALAKRGVPSLIIELQKIDEENLAELLFAFELMTAVAGSLYGVDAFNQPGVELSKKYTYALLGKPGFEGYLSELR